MVMRTGYVTHRWVVYAIDPQKSATSAVPSDLKCIGGLCMQRTEVTVSSYKQVTGKSPSSDGPNMPVTNVSYYDAKAYCEKVHMRLPTSVEWEKFAGTNEYATADGRLVDFNGKKEANFASNGPKNVAFYPPNRNGMYDMTGNVWEWVSDLWMSDGSVSKELRGGSWQYYGEKSLRVGFSIVNSPSGSNMDVGFRCVSPEASKK